MIKYLSKAFRVEYFHDKLRPVRFVIIGLFNTLLAYLFYLVFLKVFISFFPEELTYMLSFVLSFIISVGIAYLLHCKFTFLTSVRDKSQFLNFCSLYISIAILNIIMLPFLVEIMGFSPQVTQGVLYFLLPALSYIGQKRFAFKL